MSRRRAIGLVAMGTLFGTVALLFAVTLVRDDFVAGDVNARYVCLVLASTFFAIAVGVGAALRHPSAHAGWLLAAAGAGFALGVWRFSPRPLVATIALALFYATSLLPLHALVVQGDGVGVATRRFLLGADILLAVLGLVIVGTAAGGALQHWFIAAASFRHVDNPLVVWDAPGVARAFQTVWWTTLVVAAAVGTAFRLRAWGLAPRNVRRRGTVIAVASIAWVLMMLGSALSFSIPRQLGARVTLANYGVVLLPAFGLAVAAAALGWVELVEPRLARRAGNRVELSAIEPDRSGVRALLADVLGTPNLGILYARDGQWIDAQGRTADPAHDRRIATVVSRDGLDIAAILHEHDVPLEVVQLGARVTAAQLDAELATARARARAEAVRDATSELVRAGDRAALTLASELRDGPLSRLEQLAARLRADPGTLADASVELQEITARVRAVSHGFVPRELYDGGLPAVLDAGCSVTRRLPRAIEITVYLLVRDDPLATVVDETDTIIVTRTGAPTAEAAARTAALGGRIDGTVATLPLG